MDTPSPMHPPCPDHLTTCLPTCPLLATPPEKKYQISAVAHNDPHHPQLPWQMIKINSPATSPPSHHTITPWQHHTTSHHTRPHHTTTHKSTTPHCSTPHTTPHTKDHTPQTRDHIPETTHHTTDHKNITPHTPPCCTTNPPTRLVLLSDQGASHLLQVLDGWYPVGWVSKRH